MTGEHRCAGRPTGARPATRALLAVCALLIASGCASTRTAEDPGSEFDPFEPVNRKVFAFNQVLDRAVFRPLARGYDRITPAPVKTGVTNFFDNLSTPIWAFNHLLQGQPAEAGRQAGRFLMNSTFGLAGVLDPASMNGIAEKPARFDQTFGRWGVPAGPYLVLPFLGPNTPRTGLAWYARFQTDIVWNYLDNNRSVRDKLTALQFIDLRHQLLRIDRLVDEAPDPYIFTREAFRQRMEFEVRGGAPPEDEFDFEFEDDLEEEEEEEREPPG